jgi:hypothetical protein
MIKNIYFVLLVQATLVGFYANAAGSQKTTHSSNVDSRMQKPIQEITSEGVLNLNEPIYNTNYNCNIKYESKKPFQEQIGGNKIDLNTPIYSDSYLYNATYHPNNKSGIEKPASVGVGNLLVLGTVELTKVFITESYSKLFNHD